MGQILTSSELEEPQLSDWIFYSRGFEIGQSSRSRKKEVLGDVIRSIYNVVAAEKLSTREVEIRKKTSRRKSNNSDPWKLLFKRLAPSLEILLISSFRIRSKAESMIFIKYPLEMRNMFRLMCYHPGYLSSLGMWFSFRSRFQSRMNDFRISLFWRASPTFHPSGTTHFTW
jgi:hypothetical protein